MPDFNTFRMNYEHYARVLEARGEQPNSLKKYREHCEKIDKKDSNNRNEIKEEIVH